MINNRSIAYRADIDGLRAIAVLAVIINHVRSSVLPHGYLGVDIFFVISGFVITQSLAYRRHDSFRTYIAEFYNRRAKRLIPALCLCVTVTCILTLLVVSPGNSVSANYVRTGMTALFGISNIYLLRHATDYFGSSAELNPFTHTWSLGVEEQFYFIFPLLLWIGGLPRTAKKGYRNTFLMLFALGIASFACFVWVRKFNPIWAFYMMPTRFWELSLGAIVSLVTLRSFTLADRYPHTARIVHSVSMLFLIAVLLSPSTHLRQEPATIAVVLLTASLIYWSRTDSSIYKILTQRPLVYIGLISYSLYLWHWSILAISRLTIGVTLETVPFQLGLMFLLAVMSHRHVERPLRQSNWKLIRIGSIKAGVFAHSLALTTFLSVIIMILAGPLHKQGFLYTGVSASLLKKGVETLYDSSSFGKHTWSANKCVLASDDEVGKNISAEGCTFGDFSTSKRRFLVIGNSYSVAEIEMYKAIPQNNLGSVTITSSWGASVVPELENTTPWSQANDYYWSVTVPHLVAQLRAGDVLLMVNDGAEFSPQVLDKSAQSKLNVLAIGLSRISEELAKRGVYVIYQSGNPFMRESNCTPDTAMPQWWSHLRKPPCTYYSKTESLERRQAYQNVLINVQRNHPNFFVLDLFDVFCPGNTCTFFDEEGTCLYRDEWSHPSVEASVLAQPVFLSTIKRATNVSLE